MISETNKFLNQGNGNAESAEDKNEDDDQAVPSELNEQPADDLLDSQAEVVMTE